MNFKDEYKKSAESISPDREAIDRMKAAVMAKIAEEQGEFPEISGSARSAEEHPEPTPHKKPLPFKRIAVIGGAVAACAVVTVSAMTLLPNLNTSDMVAASSVAATNGSAMDTAGGAAGETENDSIFDDSVAETAADEVPACDSSAAESTQNYEPIYSTTYPTYPADAGEDAGDTLPIGDLGDYDGAAPGYAAPTEEVEPETYEEYDEATDSGNPATGADPADIPQYPDNDSSASETVPDDSLDKANGIDDDIVEDVADGTSEMQLATEEPDESGLNPSTEAPDDSIPEETLEIYLEETIECEDEVDEEYTPRLLLSSKGWLTYDGVWYDLDSSVKTAMFPLSPVTITNTLDGKGYYLYVDGRVIKVFDEQKNFIGLYRKRV
ncbi:MAG: hypothetical protein ACI4RK_05205 [Oscillospiraceae bacterium]